MPRMVLPQQNHSDMSYSDDVKIFLNLMAQSPDGLADPDLIGKFSRAKAQLHAMSSAEEMNAQNVSPVASPQPAGGMMSPQTGSGMGQPPQEPNSIQNQGGQGSLVLP